jgi:transposase
MLFSMQEFNRQFPSNDACLAYLWQMHFAGTPCTRCGLVDAFHKLPNRPAYQCECGAQIYPLAGTPFHKSTTDLRTWFLAIFFMTTTRSGMSAAQFQRITGVTYKTAWRIFKQVRLLMDDDNSPLSGAVEVDEAYIGGSGRNRKTWHGQEPAKAVVFGMVERGGRVKAKHVRTSGSRSLLPQIQANVAPGTTIYSDEYGAYKVLPKLGYAHDSVNHSQLQFRKGDAYTQSIENFWSQFKRGLYGVYRHCDRKYLQQYANEYAFRYSNRKISGGEMFEMVLARAK